MRTTQSFVMLLVFLHCTGYVFASRGFEWCKKSLGIAERKVNCLFVSPDGSYLLAGTDKAIYRAENKDSIFSAVLQNHGQNPVIHQIVQNIKVSSSIYSATDSGVFVSDDQGRSWKNIFLPSNFLARKINCILVDAQAIYAGTAEGLYAKRHGDVWKKQTLEFGQKEVFILADDQMYVYAATGSEVYRISKNDGKFQKVYFGGVRRVDDGENMDPDESVLERQIKGLNISSSQGQKIFVATGREISVSTDLGASWERIGLAGLPIEQVRRIYVLNDETGDEQIYGLSDNSVFLLKKDYWENHTWGFENRLINDIATDIYGNVYLASNDGIYAKQNDVSQESHSDNISRENFLIDFESEPNIRDVQRMAISYANVHPGQIQSWHRQARMKAFFPTVSVGFNRGDGEMYHWDTGPNPDVLRKGNDYLDWSTSLSWDFSDFIWSSDHTSIDSRSKLMSELRQDILDQVTRLYFERRRLQVELSQNRGFPSEVCLEKEIRVNELTAHLDGLTGGGFSRGK